MVRGFCYSIFRFLAALLIRSSARIRKEGFEAAGPGPYLLVCNHISHFDPPVVGVCYPRKLDFMAMRELFNHPLAGLFFTMIDTFPVSREKRDTAAVRTALQRLKRGHIVCMFPEGGIRSGNESVLEGHPLKPGAAVLAQMAGVPVRPCLVLGTDRFYSWKFWERIDLIILMGEELRLNEGLQPGDARNDLNRRIEDALRALYLKARMDKNFHESLIPRTAQERWAEAGQEKRA